MMRRWPKRREFLAYYLLLKYAGESGSKDTCINAGEAVDVLTVLTGSKRLARSLLRQLVRKGFLQRARPMVYCIRSLEELLDEALTRYIAGRLRRRGVEAEVKTASGSKPAILVMDREYCRKLAQIIPRSGLELECP
ncbi:hypothetical protein CF15_02865 [Pyrodictium occultum]|uniref:Transcription regulator TrmB N-terminal domain-containing protein n=1 Tax=Pyrodictium occultum TaxID=2309 RepID=A0A0V8RUM9_PYROC|nr:hypothetical protein [Pyrodictium occultum]KSW11766.1 hypothetical protein CF15_02865 [Pyrodictium occultum]